MHGSRKRKFELVLPRVEALTALTELTAQAASGRLIINGEPVELENFASLKIGIKHFGASSMLKVAIKFPAVGLEALPEQAGLDAESEDGSDTPQAAAVAPGPDGKPKYKGLKKRMKSTFKAVVMALRAGQAPDAGILASFIADSRLMTTYPGKGDAFYPAYDAEVDRLEQAAATGDIDAMTASVAALGRMKKECHSRHA